MSFDLRSLPAYFNSNTDFQNWVQGLHAQFAAVGLVQTSDTGQINPVTVLAPAGAFTVQGYEIWRFTDSLQSTNPVFLKVEYSSGGNTQNPALIITPGTGTNGAGTLTGSVGTRVLQTTAASKSAGITLPSYCVSDGSGLVVVTNYDVASGSFVQVHIIDRTRDGSGTATADGIYRWQGNSSGYSTCMLQIIPYGASPNSGATGGAQFNSTCISPAAWATAYAPGVLGVNLPIMPIWCVCGKFLFTKLAHLAQASQLSNGVTITANVLGGTHTLMPLTTWPNFYGLPTGSSADALCLLWE